jgi:hypothetical protein
MTDLTAITTPYGLLDDATREALKAHGGPYQVWDPSYVHQWYIVTDLPRWVERLVYRVRPSPPKPREWWVTSDDRGKLLVFDTPVRDDVHEVIHVREVTD